MEFHGTLIGVLAVALSVLGSCDTVGASAGDACEVEGQARCLGQEPVVCTRNESNELRWRMRELFGCEPPQSVCVVNAAGTDAFCGLEATTDPACPNELRTQRNVTRCVGNSYRTWSYCHRTQVDTDCASTGGICVEGLEGCGELPVCVLSTDIDDECRTAGTRCLDEDRILTCICGLYASSVSRCDANSPGYVCDRGACGAR